MASLVERHAGKLGVQLDDVDKERLRHHLHQYQHMTRTELSKMIEVKVDAMKILKLQIAAALATLDTRT